jgi:thiamine biosynthesis lipoprotein
MSRFEVRVVRVAALSLSIAVILSAPGCAEPTHLEGRWTALGAEASAEVYTRTPEGAETALDEIRQAFERVDATMSNWNADSELTRLNREAARGVYDIRDRDLYRCIKFALDYAKATDGAFDPTVGPLVRAYGLRPFEPNPPDPGALLAAMEHVGWEKVELIKVSRSIRFRDPEVEVDLGGIARGYALDVAARTFARVGCLGGLLRLDDDVYAWNHPPDREAWSVSLPDPEDASRPMATLEVANRAVSTSGNFRNAFTVAGRTYGPVMHAAEGVPARSDVISATAIADSGADADAMSTALAVAGSLRGSDVLRRSRRVEAVLLVRGRAGETLIASASLRGRLRVTPEFAERIEGRVRYHLPPLSIEN